jgi:hypothetical protein
MSLTDPSLPGLQVELAALDRWPGRHRPLGSIQELHDAGPIALLYVSGTGLSAGEGVVGTGVVDMTTLAKLPLPEIVVLNGCWSGTAVSRFGRDPFSLAVGALLGGAHTVVAGTGLIGGSASARVGRTVLDLLSDGLAAGDAVRLAQRSVRDAYPELQPHEWAGLCVVGHGK